MATKTAYGVQGKAAWVQSQAGQALSLASWQLHAWCTPGYDCAFGLLGNTVDSCSTCCWPKPIDPFPWGCSLAFRTPFVHGKSAPCNQIHFGLGFDKRLSLYSPLEVLNSFPWCISWLLQFESIFKKGHQKCRNFSRMSFRPIREAKCLLSSY